MAPKPYAVIRSTVVHASLGDVHAQVDDFHHWVAWSPWETVDSAVRRRYSGPRNGTGARYAWEGNRRAGAGWMEITRSTERAIDIDLQITRPCPAENQIEVGFDPAPGGTRVTWTMHGELTGIMKLVSLFRPMDVLMGPDFEAALGRLKAVVEGARA